MPGHSPVSFRRKSGSAAGGLARAAARAAAVAAAVVMAAAFLPQQDRTEEYKARFAHEADPVAKAKLMPKLGNAEFDDIKAQIGAGNFDAALKTLQLYHEQVSESEKLLDATGVNAVKHSAGYRQLEISLRESIRRLADLSFGVPPEQKKAFSDIGEQLDQIDQRLIRELFPRDQPPGRAPAPHS